MPVSFVANSPCWFSALVISLQPPELNARAQMVRRLTRGRNLKSADLCVPYIPISNSIELYSSSLPPPSLGRTPCLPPRQTRPSTIIALTFHPLACAKSMYLGCLRRRQANLASSQMELAASIDSLAIEEASACRSIQCTIERLCSTFVQRSAFPSSFIIISWPMRTRTRSSTTLLYAAHGLGPPGNTSFTPRLSIST